MARATLRVGRLTPAPSQRLRHRVAWRLVPFVLPALVVGLYLVVSRTGNPYFPSIGSIASAGRATWLGRGFVENVEPSLTNLGLGYLLGVGLGVLGGVLLGEARAAREIVWPVVSFALTLPPVVLLPILLLVLGIGSIVQRTVIAFAVGIIVLVNTADGVRSNDAALSDLTRVYQVRGLRRIACVVVPGAITHILAAARVGLSMAILLMVVGEMLGVPHGIGATILVAQQEFDYAEMWSGVVLLAVLGIVANAAFVAGEGRLVKAMGLVGVRP